MRASISSKPTLLWVNHASFVFQYDTVRLMTDPWLFGSAFNNGWDLLCETRFPMEDFHEITHLWFSHEHPDHFAPAVLQQIPETARQAITVLFQETNDHKVINFCRKLGFQVVELPNHGWYTLSSKIRVMCGKVPYFDSWLLIETDQGKILNANDCVVDGEGVAQEIAKQTGTVDLLLTQFSYANWIGNPEDIADRKAAATEKLARVKLQIETFQPQQTIPFASFVYFSHEENSYLNDAVNTIRDAERFIRQETESQPVVLYPGETWEVGTVHNNEPSLRNYDADYRWQSKPRHSAESLPLIAVQEAGQAFLRRVKVKNSRLLMTLMGLPPLRYFQPFTLYLTDLEQMVRFDMTNGVQPIAGTAANADIQLAAESLAYVLNYDWGYDTLEVNGRFRATVNGHKRMVKTFFLGPLNNTGRYLHPKTLFEPSFLRRALGKLRSLG